MAVLVEKPLACISGTPLYQKVLVVESVTEARVQRLLKRGLSEEEIISRMESQASDEERREVADLIIENNGSLNDLKLNTVTIWEEITLWLETEL
jgi:dephospho-CoA kinase